MNYNTAAIARRRRELAEVKHAFQFAIVLASILVAVAMLSM